MFSVDELIKEAELNNAVSQYNLGRHYILEEDNFEKARYWWEKSAAQGNQYAKDGLLNLASDYDQRGIDNFNNGKFQEAERDFKSGIELGSLSHFNLSEVYWQQEKYQTAVSLINQGIKKYETAFGKSTKMSESDLKEIYKPLGLAFHRLAFAYENNLGVEGSTVDVIICLQKAIFCQNDDAKELLNKMLAGKDKDEELFALKVRTKPIQIASGKIITTFEISENILSTIELKDVVNIASQKAKKLYVEEKNYESAIEYYYLAREAQCKIYGEDHEEVAVCYHNLGCSFRNLEKYDLAIESLLKAKNIYLKLFGISHQKVQKEIELINKITELQHKNDPSKSNDQEMSKITAMLEGMTKVMQSRVKNYDVLRFDKKRFVKKPCTLNNEQAIEYYTELHKNGDINATAELAVLFLQSSQETQNQMGIKLLFQAAKAEHLGAMYNIAYCRECGFVIKKNIIEAFQWYSKLNDKQISTQDQQIYPDLKQLSHKGMKQCSDIMFAFGQTDKEDTRPDYLRKATDEYSISKEKENTIQQQSTAETLQTFKDTFSKAFKEKLEENKNEEENQDENPCPTM